MDSGYCFRRLRPWSALGAQFNHVLQYVGIGAPLRGSTSSKVRRSEQASWISDLRLVVEKDSFVIVNQRPSRTVHHGKSCQYAKSSPSSGKHFVQDPHQLCSPHLPRITRNLKCNAAGGMTLPPTKMTVRSSSPKRPGRHLLQIVHPLLPNNAVLSRNPITRILETITTTTTIIIINNTKIVESSMVSTRTTITTATKEEVTMIIITIIAAAAADPIGKPRPRLVVRFRKVVLVKEASTDPVGWKNVVRSNRNKNGWNKRVRNRHESPTKRNFCGDARVNWKP